MFKTLKKKLMYENSWMRLWEDDIEGPDGQKGIYAYVEKKDAGPLMAPMTQDGKFILMKEWRYPNKRSSWEFCAGGVELGETMVEAAQRELREEIGYESDEWVDLGSQSIDAGGSQQVTNVFLAKQCRYVGDPVRDGNEVIEEVRAFSMDEIDEMVRNGTIDGQWTLAAITKLKVYFKNIV